MSKSIWLKPEDGSFSLKEHVCDVLKPLIMAAVSVSTTVHDTLARMNVGNKQDEVDFPKSGKMTDGSGEEVREACQTGARYLRGIRCACKEITVTVCCAVANVRRDPDEYAPDTRPRTVYTWRCSRIGRNGRAPIPFSPEW